MYEVKANFGTNFMSQIQLIIYFAARRPIRRSLLNVFSSDS
uniref:Uncharacterized protein n=1 Tax=Rhizophora mucronata TaxID=61149 RepID=A0A2P2IYG8_RHIMU